MLKRFSKEIKLDWQIAVLIILGLIFFAVYSFLAFEAGLNWQDPLGNIQNSPDETANLFFSRLFAEESRLQFADPANQVAEDLISPRSMRVIAGKTVPAGFMGLPLIYGSLAKIAGLCSIPFITPFISIIGLIFFYLLVKEIFGRNAAFIACLFAFILPGWWYYSAKTLMPNVAFVSLSITALYFFIKALSAKKLLPYVLFGIFLALSLMVRTSELVWIGLLILLIALFNLKRVNWSYLTIAFFAFLFVFLPVFHFNQQNYGSPFSLGYSLQVDFQNKNLIGQSLTLIEKIVLPFGFHPKTALGNFNDYTFGIFPTWSNLILFAFLFFAIYLITRQLWSSPDEENRKKLFFYLIAYLLVSAYLVIYYGSWNFHDHPDPEAVTIGTSYVRYWLPVYLFSLPFLGFILANYLKRYRLLTAVATILLWLILSVRSYNTVMLDNEEGLLKVKQNLKEYQSISAQVVSRTEANAVIIADRLDKAFFPQRSVIFRLNLDQDYVRIKRLIEADYPVYYFDFTKTEAELIYLNQAFFEKHDLRVGKSLLDFEKQSLYPVKIQ
ncbi:MAG TPA: glycosyltransferase family 39 protein [Patescibacteria group bacterium]|nr:glycosyltransferase family 39 protein [Patescibacteria group bacterium]